jgi:hypothetical protein
LRYLSPYINPRLPKSYSNGNQTVVDRLGKIMVKRIPILEKPNWYEQGGKPAKDEWSSFVYWIYEQTLE